MALGKDAWWGEIVDGQDVSIQRRAAIRILLLLVVSCTTIEMMMSTHGMKGATGPFVWLLGWSLTVLSI